MPLCRLGLREKKTIGACERDEVARQDWLARAETLPARRVVVIEERSTHLEMMRVYGRAVRGQRAFGKQRRNAGRNIPLLAALRLDGRSAAMVIEGAVTTAVFEPYIREVLWPTLQRGDRVVLDNRAAPKSKSGRGLLAAPGVRLLFLPPYSPDFSPIENAFAKLKAHLRRVRAQTFESLLETIASALDSLSPYAAFRFFTQAGFLNLDESFSYYEIRRRAKSMSKRELMSGQTCNRANALVRP